MKHDKNIAIGICGVIPKYWKQHLNNQGIKVNSLKACETILNHYLEQNNGDLIKSIADYKGIESKKNMYLVYRVLEIYQGIK